MIFFFNQYYRYRHFSRRLCGVLKSPLYKLWSGHMMEYPCAFSRISGRSFRGGPLQPPDRSSVLTSLLCQFRSNKIGWCVLSLLERVTLWTEIVPGMISTQTFIFTFRWKYISVWNLELRWLFWGTETCGAQSHNHCDLAQSLCVLNPYRAQGERLVSAPWCWGFSWSSQRSGPDLIRRLVHLCT